VRSPFKLSFFSLSLICAASAPAFSEVIRYEFTGSVVSPGVTGSPLHAGDRFQGTFFFDTDRVYVRYLIDGLKVYDPLFGSAGLEVNISTANGIFTFANVPGYLAIELWDHFSYNGTPPFWDRFTIYCTEFTRFPTFFRRPFVELYLDVNSYQESFLESLDLPRHLSLPGQGFAYVSASGGPNIQTRDYYVGLSVDHLALANQPPDCSAAVGRIPPITALSGGLVPVTIEGVTDPDGDPVTIAVTGVSQDEPVVDVGARPTCPDATIDEGAAKIRVERSGTGNGRVYRVAFTASDGRGGTCDGAVTVPVPHDPYQACVDDGPAYDSTRPCPSTTLAAAREGTAVLGVAPSHGRGAAFDFTLADAGEVALTVHDVAGRAIATIARGRYDTGTHHLEWRAEEQPPGIYFVRLRTPSTSIVRRFAVL